MSDLFVFYHAKKGGGEWRFNNIVMKDYPPMVGVESVSKLEREIETLYDYEWVRIQNWQRMES